MAGPFLSELNDRARAELRHRSVRRSWPAGAVIFHEGDSADRVVIIESGVVKAVVTSETGAEAVLALRGPGDVLGELAAVGGGRRSASVVGLEPVVGLVVSVDSFRDFLRHHPPAAFVLLAAIAERTREASRRQAEFGSLDTPVRLARLIADLADTYGQPHHGGVRLRLLSQEELAGLCGASREAVARALRALREAGVLETGRRSVDIPDVARLRDWRPA